MTPQSSPRLQLAQVIAPSFAPRGRFAFSADGTNAYLSSWDGLAARYTRSVSTGLLTFAETQNGAFNGEDAFLSPVSSTLFMPGINSNQLCVSSLQGGGALPANPSTCAPPSGYQPIKDHATILDHTYFASGSVMQSMTAENFSATDVASGTTKTSLVNVVRGGDYLYVTDYVASGHVIRSRIQCDGSLGPPVGLNAINPWAVAVCPATHTLYVAQRKSLFGAGQVEVFDLTSCDTQFWLCPRVGSIGKAEIPSIDEAVGLTIAPDCSGLYVGTRTTAGTPNLVVLSLASPQAPTVLETFTAGTTYDGIPFPASNGAWMWHMDWYQGSLYVPMDYGPILVFQPEP